MNDKQKELVKIFIFLLALSFVLVNWNTVSWVFNYKAWYGLAYEFFNPYPDVADALVNINPQEASRGDTPVFNRFIRTPAHNSLVIKSIGVEAPVVIGQSINKKLLEKDLNRGVVYYPGSVLPGENGQMVILGHSAPPNWPHIKYDYIFSNIENLNPGDQIILNFNNTQYIYAVTDKKIIQQGQDFINDEAILSNNILTLISCWPPGKNYQRITVTAQLQK